MKHWKILTKIDLTKKLPLSSTFLEVHLLLGTNQFWPWSVEEVGSEYSEKPAEVITDRNEESDLQIAHPSRNEADETIETLSKLSLFTKDASFDPLISKLTHIINRGKRDKIRQSSVVNFFKAFEISIRNFKSLENEY